MHFELTKHVRVAPIVAARAPVLQIRAAFWRARRGRRLAILLLLLGFALHTGPDSAPAAETSYDSRGTVLLDGAKVFPIGLLRQAPRDRTTPWGTAALDEIVGAGIDLLHVGPFGAPWTESQLTDIDAWNVAAADRGVHTWVNLRELARAQPGTARAAMLTRVVERFRDSPGVAMWKGADEPWAMGWAAAGLQYSYEATRALDPKHLSVLIQAPRGSASDLAPYSAVTDVHGFDVYPVSYRAHDPDLHRVGRWTRKIRSLTPNEVVFATLQICWSGADDPAGSGAYVMPTRRQERYMIYDAIINGARGLLFYGGHAPHCFTETDAEHRWNWTFWRRVLRGLVREVGRNSALYPALVNPGTGLPLRRSDSTTQILSRQVGTDIWVLAARYGRGPRSVRISGLPRSLSVGTVYREGRSVRVRDGSFTDRFPRWGVHVYRFQR